MLWPWPLSKFDLSQGQICYWARDHNSWTIFSAVHVASLHSGPNSGIKIVIGGCTTPFKNSRSAYADGQNVFPFFRLCDTTKTTYFSCDAIRKGTFDILLDIIVQCTLYTARVQLRMNGTTYTYKSFQMYHPYAIFYSFFKMSSSNSH